MRSEDAHLFIDAGDIGMKGRGGHGHNDTLGFELWCDGSPLIVDSGTYTYSASVKLRNEFRSTAAHNTLMVDGKELADFTGLWSIRVDETRPTVLQWSDLRNRFVLDAEHSAYASSPSRIRVRRRFEMFTSPFSLVITDMIDGSGSHLIESFLHFAPEVAIELTSRANAIATKSNWQYIVSVSAGELSLHDTSYSRSYGVRQRNATLRLLLNALVPTRVQTTIRRAAAL
jgi:hypothetical protein